MTDEGSASAKSLGNRLLMVKIPSSMCREQLPDIYLSFFICHAVRVSREHASLLFPITLPTIGHQRIYDLVLLDWKTANRSNRGNRDRSTLPTELGTVLFSKKLQRLGDLAANTVVIRVDKTLRPDLTPILADNYNSLRAYPHLAARLRQLVDPVEAEIALEAVLRRDKLEAAARIRVFGMLADHFRSLISFPETATVGLSDE